MSCVRISEVIQVSARGWRRTPGKHCMSPSVPITERKYTRGKNHRHLTEQNATLVGVPGHKLL